MITSTRIARACGALVLAVSLFGPAPAQAATYSGTIEIIEVWTNGNIAFRINGATGTCGTNNWFVLNKSDSGTKNHYAALLASKLTSRPVRVSSWGCAPAEAYNTSPYNQVDYLYVD